MRKFLSISFVILCLLAIGVNPALAARATTRQLTISGVPISATVIGSGVTVTSDSVYQAGNIGYSSLLTLVSGSIGITYKVSVDGTNWYTPYTTSAGTLTADGTVSSTGLTADRWIVMPAKLAPYIRFEYTSSGSSTISSKLVWQDD